MRRDRVLAGELRHKVSLDNETLGPPSSEGSESTWEPLTPPESWAAIEPATARDLERLVAGSVQSTATHIVKIRYRPDVTTKTRITKGLRDSAGALTAQAMEFHVTGVHNPELRNEFLILVCEQVVS